MLHEKTETHAVISSADSIPGDWGSYRRIGLVELDESGKIPCMISARARGCRRVVRTWDRLNNGKTENCKFRKTLAHALELLSEMN